MSRKMECPGCGSYLSRTITEFENGQDLSCCGLSWPAANEIIGIRTKRANDEVAAAAEAAIKRADKAEREAVLLRTQLDDIRRVLDRKPDDGGW